MIDYIHVLLHLKHEPSQAEIDLLNDLINDWCTQFCLEPYKVDMQVGSSGDEEK